MLKRRQRGDLRTWLLLVLALVPTGSVLAGAGWYWSNRGEEIHLFEDALVPPDTTYELFAISSKLLRSEASLQAAALPGATDEILDRARRDQTAALMALRDGEAILVPLIDQLDPERDASSQGQVLSLMGGSIGVATDLFAAQVPGEPIDQGILVLTELAAKSTSGLVLPFVDSGDPQAGYFYDALGTTIRYHDQFARDRTSVLGYMAPTSPEKDDLGLEESALRNALWRDVIDSRTFLPVVSEVDWFGTRQDPDSPLFFESDEPLGTLIAQVENTTTMDQRAAMFLRIQEIDDALEADVDLAYAAMRAETDDHIRGLLRERQLTAMLSGFMALLGLALLSLTISEVRRRRSVEAAHDEAMHKLGEKVDRDPTTGVWNRRRLESELLKMIPEAPTVHEQVVLAYLDLDHFKAINDVWGHGTGDEVLLTVVERLQGFTFDDVAFELCRFGGDEFVLYAQIAKKPLEWLETLGNQVIDAVDDEMEIGGRRHEVGASVGIATSNEDSTLDSLLLEADSSLILAKQERGTAVVYNRDISRTGELVHALPAALASGEICAHLQPVVDARSGEVVHVEALARWSRPNGEYVSPAVFVPLVESYGLAERLTTTILSSVQQILRLPETPEFMRVWVNVSPRELDVANFAERFVGTLRQLDLPASRVGLEITESAAVRDPRRLAIELRRLRQVGISVAIDDFGNGYSPLGYLRQLPVDIVKLDRSLIANIDTDVANQHIVIGIVGLVHELGMGIVAEGVERAQEQQWLIEHGVHRVQGFLFDKPTCPTEFSWDARTAVVSPESPLLTS